MQRKGLSLLEIMVAAVLFSITTVGLANIFIAGKRWILHTRSRMTGGALGRYFIDDLQKQVRQDQWGSNCLSTGTCSAVSAGKSDGLDRDYTATYTATPNFNSTSLSKVKTVITWTEPVP